MILKKLGVFDSGKNLWLGKDDLSAFLSLNRFFVLSLSQIVGISLLQLSEQGKGAGPVT